ncbi:MAG: undecaprenyl-phosphate galactose phosphotransferase WbaP [Bdellovibrionales bacterium]
MKRIRSPFSATPRIAEGGSSPHGEAQTRLAAIMAEVAATPVEAFSPNQRTQARRDPAVALRWFVMSDVVAFLMGFSIAWMMTALTNVFVLDRGFPLLLNAVETMRGVQNFSIVTGVMFWFWHTGHYRQRMPFWLEVQKIVSALGFAMVVDGFFQFASKQDFSRLWLMSGWVFAGIVIVLARALARRIMQQNGTWAVRTLLVGSGSMADDARAALRSEQGLGYEVVMQVENLSLLLKQVQSSWQRLCERFNADYIVIALDGTALAQADEAMAQLVRSGIPFSVSPPLRHLPVLGMAPQYFFSHDVMLFSPVNNLEQPLPRFLKRSMDLVGSGLALLALSPLFLVLALLVRRDGGSVCFGDVRVGMKGKAFHCLKFRSMVIHGDEILQKYLDENPERAAEWKTYHKLRDGDPRVTKIGAFMRRWSIDELPQLINVFKGDMSLVGPRPIMFRERAIYSDSLVQYSRVRPGLTGLWQVSGRSNVSFLRRVQMDCWYVRNWSLWHDIAIICKTIPVVLRKTGAC